MDYLQKERKALTGQWSGRKRKVVNLETFYYQGGVWYSLKTGKPEKVKRGGKK